MFSIQSKCALRRELKSSPVLPLTTQHTRLDCFVFFVFFYLLQSEIDDESEK